MRDQEKLAKEDWKGVLLKLLFWLQSPLLPNIGKEDGFKLCGGDALCSSLLCIFSVCPRMMINGRPRKGKKHALLGAQLASASVVRRDVTRKENPLVVGTGQE